ncbi:Protein phosphatase 1 regulatory subunit 12A [Bagarius yarrelli]|uniref:Protein phosphatase 1 regulatory subunit n=1 Tax=Bagarius yarrelli TaxID=175774 RepID=A0A556VW73_BAGYA|nr:Protein phosphatase 1 regulatory subunit 12A [Bagarius yarrelli]
MDMVTFLVEHGACINQPDNEGWIPLHAAASCGYVDIAEYLISEGANVGVVNSEGETPMDIAEEEAMEELLKNEINRQGSVDIEAARKEEERIMLRDARQWLNSGQINDVRHTKSGGTALHGQTPFDVADEDVLGYLEELQKKQNLLMSEKKDARKSPLIETTTTADNNQSTKPAVKSKETLLLEEKNAPHIENLETEKADEVEDGKKDESSCSSEEEDEDDTESENEADKTKSSTPGSNSTSSVPAPITTPVSTSTNNLATPTLPVKKVSVPAGKVSPKEEERKDESPASWRLGLRKTGSYGALAEISATKEAQKEKDLSGVMRSASSPRLTTSLDNKDKDKEKEKSLAYVAPTFPRRHPSASDIDEKENRDSAASLVRSGSYSRRRWDEDPKNNDTAFLNRTTSYQRSTSHTLTLGRSSSSRDLPAKSSSASSLDPNSTKASSSYYQLYNIHHSGSFGKRQDNAVSSTSTVTTTTSSTSTTTITSPTGHRSVSRFWHEDGAEKEKELATVIPTINTAATTTTTTTHTTSGDSRERRRSYLTPVRDEESESQRKARSRQARQSRRSTQGVTLTDLQEAEKTIGRSRPIRSRDEEKEKQDKEKQEEKKEAEVKEDDYRSRYRFEERYRTPSLSSSSITTAPSSSTSTSSLYTSSSSLNRPDSLSGITPSYRSFAHDTERDKKQEEKEGEDKTQPRSIRDRRRPREKRRSTGVPFWTQDSDENDPEQHSDSEEGSTKTEPQSERLSRSDGLSSGSSITDRYELRESRRPYSRIDRDDHTDYKKLYEQIQAENEKLKSQLHDTHLELEDLKRQLEKATQERRALERKISEMEEELKTLPDLKADNQRLKDENGALIRVISKLSK